MGFIGDRNSGTVAMDENLDMTCEALCASWSVVKLIGRYSCIAAYGLVGLDCFKVDHHVLYFRQKSHYPGWVAFGLVLSFF